MDVALASHTPGHTRHVSLGDFDKAAKEAKVNYPNRVHALLGNGFTRACRDNIFPYGALFDRADFANLSPSARDAFEALGTRDFEMVIRALRQASRLAHLYGATLSDTERMRADADRLRDVLVSAIASSHPDHPNEIPDERYAACRGFLSHFNKVYTLNYDLLLYWALMHDDVKPCVNSDDGFRNPEEDGVEYVTWDPAASNRDQNIYYVHGGLHLFDTGADLVKYCWSRTGIRLIDQVRSALTDEKYPLFVAEGHSNEKLDRIRHHAYLARIERSMLEITGALFLYGVSCSESDSHILDWIAKGKLSHLYVGIYGDPESKENRELQRRIGLVAERRAQRRPLRISYFDAPSARAWG